MRKINEVFINGVCLEEILEEHKRWLNEEDDGEKADLMGAYLSDVDLSYVDLRYTDLRGTNLSGANLREANLKFANLSGVNLNFACLNGANLKLADLSDTDLSDADLRDANLSGADLSNAKLIGANLSDADLRNANLNKISYNHQTSFFTLVCPEEGSFIGYKKADDKIVKLLITEDSKRSSGTTRKCRCSKAKVLSITNIENTEEYNEAVSNFDKNFIYKTGEIVEAKDFNDDRWNECSIGIHFFITRDEAVIY